MLLTLAVMNFIIVKYANKTKAQENEYSYGQHPVDVSLNTI